jgi:hypothetical protein
MTAANRSIADEDVQVLAGISAMLQPDYVNPAQEALWAGSPFAWVRTRPSRQVGKIGEQLVAGWCAAKGLDVTATGDSEADRVIMGRRAEIKFSTLWASGTYTFQQFRDQNYEIAICLGICPFNAHCWVITKATLYSHVIGHTPQHGGSRGQDTFWIQVDPDAPPPWLAECGGRLSDAYRILRGGY